MTYQAAVNKIDNQAVDGLSGVSNSMAYKVHEIEKHFHNHERWFGKLGSQTATAWADEDSLVMYRAISGNNEINGGDFSNATFESTTWER